MLNSLIYFTETPPLLIELNLESLIFLCEFYELMISQLTVNIPDSVSWYVYN